MKKLLATLAPVVVLSAAARAQQHEYQDDPWAEDAKEWECSFPKETPAKPNKDPVYKTELFFTYGDFNKRTLRAAIPLSQQSAQAEEQPCCTP